MESDEHVEYWIEFGAVRRRERDVSANGRVWARFGVRHGGGKKTAPPPCLRLGHARWRIQFSRTSNAHLLRINNVRIFIYFFICIIIIRHEYYPPQEQSFRVYIKLFCT